MKKLTNTVVYVALFSAIILGFWIGAVIALSILLYQKVVGTRRLRKGKLPITMKSEIPFAPFLILGTLLALMFHADLFNVHMFFI